jgi:hypothetical protein
VRYHSGVVVIDQCCCGGCLTAREASAADSRGRLFDYRVDGGGSVVGAPKNATTN